MRRIVILIISLFLGLGMFAQTYHIERGKVGVAKIKYLDNSSINITENQIVFDMRMKYQKNRTRTVYNIESKQIDKTFIYYDLTFDYVGAENYIVKFYLYDTKIITIFYDLISGLSFTSIYEFKRENIII